MRVELVKYCFERYEIDHLIHKFVFPSDPSLGQNNSLTQYRCENLELIPCDTYDQAWDMGMIHNGNCCMTREVALRFRWDKWKGQDVRFNKLVYAQVANKVVLNAPLLVYRRELSSWKK